jgi:GAF domain-containing protein
VRRINFPAGGLRWGKLYLICCPISFLWPSICSPIIFSLESICGFQIWRISNRIVVHCLRSFLFETLPFLFAPTLIAVYRELGEIQFALLALGVLLVAMTTFNISVTRQRLERRVQELTSLQQISRLLSASLDLDTVINVIHTETAKVMPVSTFFVALVDADTGKIQFPRVLREGEPVEWEQRQWGHGLTEYVLRQRKSLLIPNDVLGFLRDNNMDLIGESTSCWLGVPILAGDEILGVLSVQSISRSRDLYDQNDQALLEAIASQAAMALKNARLYGQTNAALRRRVRELVSIMRTTTDGLLLIGGDGRVLAVNHAFADAGRAGGDGRGRPIRRPRLPAAAA